MTQDTGALPEEISLVEKDMPILLATVSAKQPIFGDSSTSGISSTPALKVLISHEYLNKLGQV